MDRKRIADLVRGRRKARKLSLRTAAALTEGVEGVERVAFTTWNQVETGELNFSAETLGGILYALDAHLEIDLRIGRWQQPVDPMQRDLIDRLASIVDRLPEHAVRALLAQVEAYESLLGIDRNNSR